jgi:hypothetical protein
MGYHLEKLSKIYYGSEPVLAWKEIDFTGRWKIVNADGNSTLYLECFYIILESTKTKKTIPKFLFWKKDIMVESVKARAKVEWVEEQKLRIIDTYINTCGESHVD